MRRLDVNSASSVPAWAQEADESQAARGAFSRRNCGGTEMAPLRSYHNSPRAKKTFQRHHPSDNAAHLSASAFAVRIGAPAATAASV
jgi:hypothetical protein